MPDERTKYKHLKKVEIAIVNTRSELDPDTHSLRR